MTEKACNFENWGYLKTPIFESTEKPSHYGYSILAGTVLPQLDLLTIAPATDDTIVWLVVVLTHQVAAT
jgi:hypothetical protein